CRPRRRARPPGPHCGSGPGASLGTSHMLDERFGARLGPAAVNGDDVDAHWAAGPAGFSQPTQREAPQPGDLLAGDRLEPGAEPEPAAGFHLADDHRGTVQGHDVDLADLAAPVPREDDEPFALQVPHGDLLAVLPDLVLDPHRPHLRHRACRGRTRRPRPLAANVDNLRLSAQLWTAGPDVKSGDQLSRLLDTTRRCAAPRGLHGWCGRESGSEHDHFTRVGAVRSWGSRGRSWPVLPR